AFALWRDCEDRENYVVHADGSNRRPVIDIVKAGGCSPAREWSPAWAPDGTKLAFLGLNRSPAIPVVNADGTNPRDYGPERTSTNERWLVSWSPDGMKIAFASEYDKGINIMHADGTNLKQLIQVQVSYKNDAGGLSWSPDGTKIAFVSTDNDNQGISVI